MGKKPDITITSDYLNYVEIKFKKQLQRSAKKIV